MKNIRKVTIIAAVVLVVGATGVTGFAASLYQSPAEALAGITGQTVESVIAERQETDKSYGKIAADAGKLEEFKAQAREMKKDKLNAQVADGIITQEKADTIIKTIEDNQANCDGNGSHRIGQDQGARFGMNGQGQGQGQGLANGNHGQGMGQAQGQGQGGMRLQDGSCGAQVK